MNQRKSNDSSTPTLGKSMVDSMKIINQLSAEELIALNEMIISRLKAIRREECAAKSQQFKLVTLFTLKMIRRGVKELF